MQEAQRNGLLHVFVRDLFHALAQLVNVLNIDGGDYRDARFEQLLHVLPAAGIRRSGRIIVGQAIHQANSRMPRENGLHIHHRSAIHDLQRDHLQLTQQRVGFRRSFGLDGAHHNILTAFVATASFVQHAKRLSHSGCVAEKDFQLASALVIFFRLGLLQELFGSAFAGNGRWHACTFVLYVPIIEQKRALGNDLPYLW